MSVPVGLVTYLVVWLISLFLVLPIGVHPQQDPVPGTPASAPERPRMWIRAFATTVLASVLWFIIWLVVTSGVIDLRDTG